MNWKLPFIIRYLDDKVKEWKNVRGALYIKIKESSFDELILYQRSMKTIVPFSYEYTWEFLTGLHLIKSDEMNEEYRRLYREMKSYECQFEWKSPLILKRFSFKEIDEPFNLSKILPQVKMREDLRTFLMSDKILMKFIKRAKPDKLYLLLDSGLNTTLEDIDIQERILNFYLNPKYITWRVSLIKGPVDEFLQTRRAIRRIYNVLERLNFLLKEFLIKKSSMLINR